MLPSDNDTTTILIGRQAIYDRELRVYGYELLYRHHPEVNHAEFSDGDLATTQVILNTFIDIGLENLVGNARGFINLTASFIRSHQSIPMPPDQVVLELLASIPLDNEIIAGVTALRQAGFIIALDGFQPNPRLEPLLHLAHLVKVNLRQTSPNDLSRIITIANRFECRLIATRIESAAEFERCKALGFDYFQGYHFSRPQIISNRPLSGNRLVVLNLIAKLQDPQVKVEQIETLIAQDVALTYRLLRYINSASFALRREVDSLRQAIILLGLRTIRNWVSLLLLVRNNGQKPQDLVVTALTRGRMCQLLGDDLDTPITDSDQLFTLGLFSTLELFLDRPLADLLQEIPLSHTLKEALLHHKGELGQLLYAVIAYESGEWAEFATLPNAPTIVRYRTAYLEAIAWAEEQARALNSP
jgi:c-di-GMP phosphodiesterase